MAKNGITLDSDVFQKWATEAYSRKISPTRLISEVLREINPGSKSCVLLKIPDEVILAGKNSSREWIEDRIPRILNLIFSDKID